MTPESKAESLIVDAIQQGYSRPEAIEVVAFAVDKIINHVKLSNHEYTYWIEVMDYLERNSYGS